MIATLARAGAVFCGAADDGAPSRAVLERLTAMVACLPADQRALLRAGVFILDWIAVPRYMKRFRRLDAGRAEHVLRWLARAPIAPLRRLHASLKMITQMAWYADPARWPEIGYDGPWLGTRAVDVGPGPKLAP